MSVRPHFYFIFCFTMLCNLFFTASASDSKDNPTIMTLDQKIRVPASNFQDQYFAIDLKVGQSVTFLGERIQGYSPCLLSIYRPDHKSDQDTKQSQYINRGLWFHLNVAVPGRYLLQLSNCNAENELAVYQSFAEPGVTDQSRPIPFNNHTSAYLKSGKYSQHIFDNVFRFEAKKGDEVSIQLKPLSNAAHLRVTLKAFITQPHGFYDYFYTPFIKAQRINFKATQTGLYFLQIEQDYPYYEQGTAEYELDVQGIRPDLDDDQDGLSNTAEYFRETDPQLADTNHNGFSDSQDVQAGRYGKYSVEWQHDDLAGATTAETAKEIPYLDKSFTFWTLSKPRYLLVPQTRGHIYEYVDRRLDNSANTSYVRVVTATNTAPNLQIIRHNSDEVQFGGSYEKAVYRSFANPDTTDSQRTYSHSQNTAHYLTEGLFDVKQVSMQRFEARAGDRVQLKVTPHGIFPDSEMMIQISSSGRDIRHDLDASNNGKPVIFDFIATKTDVYFLTVGHEGSSYQTELLQIRPDADDDQDGLSNTAELFRGLNPTKADTNGNGINDADDIRQGRFGLFQTEWDYAQVQHATTPELAVEIPGVNQKFSIDNVTGDFYLKIPVKANQPFTLVQSTPKIGFGGQEITEVWPDKDGWYYFNVRHQLFEEDTVHIGVFMGFSAVNPASPNQFNGSFSSARPLTSDLYYIDATPTDRRNDMLGNFFRFEAIANQPVTLTLKLYDIDPGKLLSMRLYPPFVKRIASQHSMLTSVNVNTKNPEAVINFTPHVTGTYYLAFNESSFSAGSEASFRITTVGVPADRDPDQDGLSNMAEYVQHTNPYQADTNQNGLSDLADLQQNGWPELDTSLMPLLLNQGTSADTAVPLPTFNREYVLKTSTTRYISFTAKQGDHLNLRVSNILEYRQFGEMPSNWPYDDQLQYEICQLTTTQCQVIENQQGDFVVPVTGTYVVKLYSPRPTYDAVTVFAVYQGHQNAGVYDDSRRYQGSLFTAKLLTPGYHTMNDMEMYYRFDAKKDIAVNIRLNLQNGRSSQQLKIYAIIYTKTGQVHQSAEISKTGVTELNFTPEHNESYYLKLVTDPFNWSIWSMSVELTGVTTPEYPITTQVIPTQGGTIQCTANTVSHGQSISCNAAAAKNYQFSHWQLAACGNKSQCTLPSVMRPYQLAAHFRAIYRLSLDVKNQLGGEVISAPDTILAGDQAVFVFAPKPGFRVSRMVKGNCPAGKWTETNKYELGPVSAGCHVEFSFEKITRKDGLPWWVLMATTSAT